MVSRLGFGGAPIGFLNTDRQRVATLLNFMLDHGVTVIDTAAMYAGSEELIGQSIGHRRKEFVLITKCGKKLADIPAPAFSPELITQTVDRALRRLKTDVIDVMLLHTCDLETLTRGLAIGALIKAQTAGKVRHIGYSGDNDTVAYAAKLPGIAVIQTSVNIADQANLQTVLPLAISRNIGVMAKRPIANAAWKESSQQSGGYGRAAQQYHNRLKKMKLNPAELGISGPPHMAWPELALRFTLSLSGVHTAIIGTTNPEHAIANLAAAARGPLPKDVVETIRKAFITTRGTDMWQAQQ